MSSGLGFQYLVSLGHFLGKFLAEVRGYLLDPQLLDNHEQWERGDGVVFFNFAFIMLHMFSIGFGSGKLPG